MSKMLQGVGVVAVIFGVAHSACAVEFLQRDRPEEPLHQGGPEERDCGPNSLYVFLRICGIHVTREDLRAAMPSGERGVSMEDLRVVALSRRLDVNVVKTVPGKLASVPLPAVAHLEAGEGTGHYVTVIAVDGSDFVHSIDGSSGELIRWDHGAFCNFWTGYLLIPSPGWLARFKWIVLVLCCVAIAAAGVVAWRTRT